VDARHHRRTANAGCRGGQCVTDPKLDKSNLKFDRSYIYDQSRPRHFDRIVDAFETPEQTEIYKLAETKMALAAEESDLLKQASDNTKAMLTSMAGSAGIQVTFIDN
jgi:hypothetical protein